MKIRKIVSTTENKPWEEQIVTNKLEDCEKAIHIKINTHIEYQKIEGFGGCFNEMGWDALLSVKESERQKILNDLFSKENGCAFTLCRMPVAANDYSIDWYSYNESRDDCEMKNFSIEQDEKYLLPYINAAKKYSPDLRLWASPWCPPSWMKKNDHYACETDPEYNDLDKDKEAKEMETIFRMEPEILKAYALYFSKFIKAYKKKGHEIYAVHVQNELNSCQKFPSCVWHPNDMATFIGKYLGPHFEQEQLNTQIWLGTIERPDFDRVSAILEEPDAMKYIKGVGFQWAGKGAIQKVHETYSDLNLMQTETECGNGSNDWDAAEYTSDLIFHYLKNGTRSYMYWNMVLDESGVSRWGWKQNSMISVNKETGAIRYNPEYYLMKHFGHFITEGSARIEVNSSLDNVLAFKTQKGEIICVIHNTEDKDIEVVTEVNGEKLNVKLPANSFSTVVLQ